MESFSCVTLFVYIFVLFSLKIIARPCYFDFNNVFKMLRLVLKPFYWNEVYFTYFASGLFLEFSYPVGLVNTLLKIVEFRFCKMNLYDAKSACRSMAFTWMVTLLFHHPLPRIPYSHTMLHLTLARKRFAMNKSNTSDKPPPLWLNFMSHCTHFMICCHIKTFGILTWSSILFKWVVNFFSFNTCL